MADRRDAAEQQVSPGDPEDKSAPQGLGGRPSGASKGRRNAGTASGAPGIQHARAAAAGGGAGSGSARAASAPTTAHSSRLSFRDSSPSASHSHHGSPSKRKRTDASGHLASPASSHADFNASTTLFYKMFIEDNMMEEPFWFPLVEVPEAFASAFQEADANSGETDPENKVYHKNFQSAWEKAFSSGDVPQKRYCANSAPDGFDEDKPDFLTFAAGDRRKSKTTCLGAIDLKRKEDRMEKFLIGDITQVIRYGRHILANQPLRDSATVCLCTLAHIMFVRVHRHDSTIHCTPSEPMAELGMASLYAYLTAAPAIHGVRDIRLGSGYTLPHKIHPGIELGRGSFATVLRIKRPRTGSDGQPDAALKLYQRIGDSHELFGREVSLLRALADDGKARERAPALIESDPAMQYILMSPVGTPLLEEHLCRDKIADLVEAVRAVHEVCIHRDLRAANILIGPDGRVLIIDWNLAIPKAELARPHAPAGALCVQGKEVLKAIAKHATCSYSHREDLQSIVRALYLLIHTPNTPHGVSAIQWSEFWDRCLYPQPIARAPFRPWINAEMAACSGDYDALKEALLEILA